MREEQVERVSDLILDVLNWQLGLPGGSVVKNPSASAGNANLITGLGRSPGEGNDTPLPYSCLENPMDRGAWGGASVHGVPESRT